MRFIKTAAAVLIILVVTVAVIGLFLPARYSVERSVVIDAEPGEIHEYVGNLKRWDEWAPWKEEDPSIVITLGEKTSGDRSEPVMGGRKRDRGAYNNGLLSG